MSLVMQSASVSISSSGDNTVISATAGQTILVYALALTTASPIDVEMKDGASTTLGIFQGITAVVLDPLGGQAAYGTERYRLTAGNAFIVNLSSGVATKGTVWYVKN